MKFIVLILCVFSLLASSRHAVCVSTDWENPSLEQRALPEEQRALPDSCEHSELIEFEFADAELLELGRWKDKSFEDMWNDACACDRAALFMTGMAFLTGSTGLTIDVQKADFCFSRSASFGFAPALKQIIHKNIEEGNIFLVLVYSNLMTSLGHSEYVLSYHELRTKAMTTFGNGISKEIERMASSKKELIFNNIENLSNSKDKKTLFVEMSYDGTLINHQDKEFNQDYWIKFSKFQSEAENQARRFQEILNNDFSEFKELYENSRKNLSIAIDKLKKDEMIDELQLKAVKDARKGIEKSEELIVLLISFQNTPNANLRKMAKEFLLLCQNAKGVLEMHRSFFLAPTEFLESDACMSKFADYNTGVALHTENIEDWLEKLNKNERS